MERTIAIQKIAANFSIPEEEIHNFLNEQAAPKKNLFPPPVKSKKPTPTKLPGERLGVTHSKNKYFFLEDDYLIFLDKMRDVADEIQRIGDEVGESCAESESYHDNFCYEEGSRQQRLWKDHIRYLQGIKENSEVIKVQINNGRVNIGSIVEMEKNGKETITKKIGSYITFSDESLSYNSPLAKILIGKTVGSEIHKKINNENVYFKIKSIK